MTGSSSLTFGNSQYLIGFNDELDPWPTATILHVCVSRRHSPLTPGTSVIVMATSYEALLAKHIGKGLPHGHCTLYDPAITIMQ